MITRWEDRQGDAEETMHAEIAELRAAVNIFMNEDEGSGTRAHFTLACLFGMPGISGVAGCLKVNPDGKFSHPSSEKAFQIWLRGYKAAQPKDLK